jgi:hypothetical protein
MLWDASGRMLETVDESGVDVFRRQSDDSWKIRVSHAFTEGRRVVVQGRFGWRVLPRPLRGTLDDVLAVGVRHVVFVESESCWERRLVLHAEKCGVSTVFGQHVVALGFSHVASFIVSPPNRLLHVAATVSLIT